MRSITLLLTLLPVAVWAGGLQFSETTRELSPAVTETSITAIFPFTNVLDKAVKIVRMESECSCMTIETKDKKMQLSPGESSELRGTFLLGSYTGTVEKTIRVWLEDDPGDKPSALLKVKVHIPELVSIEPKTTRWDLKSATDPKLIQIKFPAEAPAKITGITSSDEKFTSKLKTIENGRVYEIEISCASTANKALSVLKIDTDSSLPQQKSFQVFAVVK